MSPVRSDTTPGPDRLGAVLTALADDTRRSLLVAIAGSGGSGGATATELSNTSTITRQAVAKHLAVLADAGLVTAVRSGRENRYRVVPGSLRPAGDWLTATDAAWSRRLGRLEQHLAERRR